MPAFGKYCSIFVNAHTSLEGWFIGKNVEAQRGPFLKSHRWKALGLRFECRQPNSRCLGYFNTSAFQMHFFNPKVSLKMKMCVEIQYIKEIKLQLLNLNGVVLGGTSLAQTHPTMAPESLSRESGSLGNIILSLHSTTLSWLHLVQFSLQPHCWGATFESMLSFLARHPYFGLLPPWNLEIFHLSLLKSSTGIVSLTLT